MRHIYRVIVDCTTMRDRSLRQYITWTQMARVPIGVLHGKMGPDGLLNIEEEG